MASELSATHGGLDAPGDVAGLWQDGVFPGALVAADGSQNLCPCSSAGGCGEVLGVMIIGMRSSPRLEFRGFAGLLASCRAVRQ